MKALVLEQYNKLVYKEVEIPQISDNEVLIKVKACGICGSDVHGMDGSTGRRIPPLIMGHEASGEIISTGKKVRKWKEGDRVTFDSTVYPLNDWYTLQGRYNLSDHREVMGVSAEDFRRNGAFAEFVAVPEHILYRIPDEISFVEATMAEPAAVALHAINRGSPSIGESCVVVGAGTIGIFLVKLLSASGISPLIVADIDARKRKEAEEAGATHSFAPGDHEFLAGITGLTFRGADLSFEAVGINDSLSTAMDVLRKGGRTVVVGNRVKTANFPLQKIVTEEITILGSCAIRGEYETVLELMKNGKLKVKDQISEVAALKEGAEWFEKLRNKNNQLKKIILVP